MSLLTCSPTRAPSRWWGSATSRHDRAHAATRCTPPAARCSPVFVLTVGPACSPRSSPTANPTKPCAGGAARWRPAAPRRVAVTSRPARQPGRPDAPRVRRQVLDHQQAHAPSTRRPARARRHSQRSATTAQVARAASPRRRDRRQHRGAHPRRRRRASRQTTHPAPIPRHHRLRAPGSHRTNTCSARATPFLPMIARSVCVRPRRAPR